MKYEIIKDHQVEFIDFVKNFYDLNKTEYASFPNGLEFNYTVFIDDVSLELSDDLKGITIYISITLKDFKYYDKTQEIKTENDPSFELIYFTSPRANGDNYCIPKTEDEFFNDDVNDKFIDKIHNADDDCYIGYFNPTAVISAFVDKYKK